MSQQCDVRDERMIGLQGREVEKMHRKVYSKRGGVRLK